MIIEKKDKINFLSKMILIREFELQIVELVKEGKIKGPIHTAVGQEATIVGACLALEKCDYVMGNHRSHGYMLARGANLNALMDEIFGKETGVNHGRGGSMHLADASSGSLGATGIVGSGIPIVCGAALTSKIKKNGRVSMVFFGDGASNEGTAHESMNLAATWNLPVIFLLENNGCAVTVTSDRSSNIEDLFHRAAGYGMQGSKVDGQNVEAVYEEVYKMVERARTEEKPALVEAKTYRFREHGEGRAYNGLMDRGYRDMKHHNCMVKEEDPIQLYGDQLIEEGVITKQEINDITKHIQQDILDSVIHAQKAIEPNKLDYKNNIFWEA